MNKLFKLTSNHLIQTWEIEVEGAKFRTKEGILDGAITTSKWTECIGKNMGSSNATTPEQQAQKEALAKWIKKRETYYERVEDIYRKQYFEPMLAKKYEDYPVEFPVFSQPKLDGVRAIIMRDGMFSRNGKPIVSAPHILRALAPLFENTDIKVLDGELYAHKFHNNFNKIISLAKRTKPSQEDLAESAKHLQYWVYDYYSNELDFTDRNHRLQSALIKHADTNIIKSVSTDFVQDQEELDNLYAEYLGEGFEGQMIRRPEGLYENKRSKNLLKRKTWQDEEFELLGLLPGKGNLAEVAAIACFRTSTGMPFTAGIIGDQAYAKNLLQNKDKFIGRQATVVYQNLTPGTNIPRFPKMKVIRDYE